MFKTLDGSAKSVWYLPHHFIISIYDVNASRMKSLATSTRHHALRCAYRVGECSALLHPYPSNQILCNDKGSAMVCGLRFRVLQPLLEIRFLTLLSLSPALMSWDSQLQTQMSSFGSLWSWLALKYGTCFTSLSGLGEFVHLEFVLLSFKNVCFLKWSHIWLRNDYLLLAKMNCAYLQLGEMVIRRTKNIKKKKIRITFQWTS